MQSLIEFYQDYSLHISAVASIFFLFHPSHAVILESRKEIYTHLQPRTLNALPEVCYLMKPFVSHSFEMVILLSLIQLE